MPAKLLILAFDALEETLVDRWAAEGSMPTFAALGRRGTTFELDNNLDIFPDTGWTELTTGKSAPAAGVYWQPEQIHVGEARLRANTPDDFHLTRFWRLASDAGRRVAVIDAVYAPPDPGVNGVVLRDWGAHSAGYGRGSDPPGYIDEIVSRYGDYPIPHGWSESEQRSWGCDADGASRETLEKLPRQLSQALEVKTRAVIGELDREAWDLFFACFHEGHCAGHQLWHYMDDDSPWYEPDAPAELKDGVKNVYRQLDDSLRQVLQHVDAETDVFVLLTRGMTTTVGGWQLLPEILVRLGYSSAGTVAGSVRSHLPAPVRRLIRAVIRGRLRHRVKSVAGTPQQPFENPRTKAAWVRCGMNGAIRLNVRGRDPFGSVDPGEEYDAICADLKRELEALRDTETGEPVVTEVVRSDELFGERYHPNLPDVLVRYRQERVITSVTSPRIGTISKPVRHDAFPRSGEHTSHVRLWHLGPEIQGGRKVEDGNILDVSATVLERLAVPIPDDLDGKPLSRGDRVSA
jgi:predicted AlkP superfamily phosphohydrolase/phosphomutase